MDLLPHELEIQAAAVAEYGQVDDSCFRSAAQEWMTLAEILGLSDMGRLGPATNGNVVRKVVDSDGSQCVLKVSVTPAHAEAFLLSAYRANGLPVPAVLQSGHTEQGRPWLLCRAIPGQEPEDPLLITGPAASLAARMRIPALALTTRSSFSFEDVRSTIEKDTLMLASRIEAILPAAHLGFLPVLLAHCLQGPDFILHADFRPRNTLLHENKLYVFDPFGGVGSPEAEISVWVAMAASLGATDAVAAIDAAVTADTILAHETLSAWVCLRMLLLAAEEPSTGFLRRDPEVIAALALRAFTSSF